MPAAIGLETVIGVAATVITGVTTPLECYVGLGPSSTSESIDLADPIGSLGCQYDVGQLRLFAEHLSSPATHKDSPGVNHAGAKFLQPITSSLTAYVGGSYGLDSKQLRGGNWLAQGGVELDVSPHVQLYGEYLTTTDSLADGKVHGGVKLLF